MKLIKRYQNRKLYDTDASAYVTLTEIQTFVKQGVIFQVVCQKTRNDLTGKTLLSIIEMSETSKIVPPDVDLLRVIIGTGDGTFTNYILS